jgi:hypothetical protein
MLFNASGVVLTRLDTIYDGHGSACHPDPVFHYLDPGQQILAKSQVFHPKFDVVAGFIQMI